MQRIGLGLAIGALLLAVAGRGLTSGTSVAPSAPEATHWRHPVALALLDDGKVLVTANQRAGSVSYVNLRTQHVEEIGVGKRVVDIITESPGSVLVVDEGANQLMRLRLRDEGTLAISERHPVPPGPSSVRIDPNGKRAYVTSRWGKSVSAIDLSGEWRVLWTRPLSFAPRPLTVSPDGKWLIAGGAFAGEVALIDAGTGTLAGVRELPGHNLSGFTWSPDGKSLFVAYSVMDQTTDATMYNVHWGNVVVHRLRQLDARSVVRADADLLEGSKHLVLDGLINGATDPGASAFDPAGRLLLCISGLDSLMVNACVDGQRQRLRVGQRPAGIVVDPEAKRAYVANTFDDTVSVIDLSEDRTLSPIRLGATPALTDAIRGEQLFHTARLSHNGWMSCHTCHSAGHTNGKRADTLADGSHTTPKRTLSLLGVGETGPWNWRGQSERLEDVVDRTLRTTMFPDEVFRDDVRALTAYLRALPPPPTVAPSDPLAVQRGKVVFDLQGCARCHPAPLYTSNKVVDVGIHDEKGAKEYNPPSLRGVRLGGPYFHDSRAKTLEAVFKVHKHQLRGELSAEELRDLLAFLESL